MAQLLPLLISFLVPLFTAQAAPTPPSKISVPRVEVQSYLAQHQGVTHAEALRRLGLFQLAVREAKRKGWDQDAATQHEIDKAIYASYLRHVRDASSRNLEPTDNDVRQAYDQQPEIRVRLLTLRDKSAQAQLEKIRAQWQAGTPFEKLVLEHSQDEWHNVGGDLDYRGAQNLPTAIYDAARQLKKNAVSRVIQTTEAIHLVQLMDTRPFSKADASYLTWLRGGLRNEREKAILSASLAGLKDQIEISEGEP